MRSALLAVLATTTRASLVAKDRDHYQKYWARSRDKGRCNAKHCKWIGGFDAIDVDCRIEIDRDGLANGGRVRLGRGDCLLDELHVERGRELGV